ncbi:MULTISPECIES: branched-chain amino acid transporter BcaP [Bacillaceae]|jgi:amino acid transporter|uniref:Branched-chain amino acid permease BcaP n=11 Tax=Bacilli TaxID=91061 RepID=BCAP_BACSU|nr:MULTISPECIES: branched-chain amino acid transporter BcaP [Bacillales]NP_388827.1 branched-chain amino acid transporter or methylthioribose-degradation metabolite exporter [Bacillus subtilis subsp. subtilis str. 168]O07576.1 RecName: Full=Branched-chain amino acid permease BcaP; Short=BCAA permease [Bacillus subtilis subsp. subtilis str. 168]AOL32721.1 amino acid permease [Alkalicoccobacillus gibsonii]AXC52228.1 amino acid permease [Bacillus spizizenii]MDP4102302.1 branched-chain amino acid 
MKGSVFRKKSIQDLIAATSGEKSLKRELGAFDLTLLGIGAIIGTGIFVLTGTGAVTAGPGLTISFVVAALACLFAALSYAEFASSVPVSGSVYTFTYATLGELMAFIIGWDLILEYMLAVSAVSVGWSGYFQSFLSGLGIHLPVALTAAPGAVKGTFTLFNLPAFVIVMAITYLLYLGIKESKRVNNIMVILKILVVLLFIAVAAVYVKPHNWQPFMPMGFGGVFSAAALVFFAFIGFDAVSSAAEETKNPAKDLPKGIIFSLLVCTILYVTVSAIMTGVIPFAQFAGVDHPVSLVLQSAGQNWVAGIIDIGAVLGMTTVMLVMLYGQTRVMFAMSRDGLVPGSLSKVHPKHKTPYVATWFFGTMSALLGSLVPLDELAKLVNIGTLSAFVLISVAVIVLRKKQPDLPRAFKCPGVPVIPGLAILFCLFLILNLGWVTIVRFLVWLLIGLVIYFLYSRKHSKLNQ